MLFLKLLIAWMAIAAVLAVLCRCGMGAHHHGCVSSDANAGGCRYCPSAGTCRSVRGIEENTS